MQGLHEQRIPRFLRRLRGVFLFPAFQQMQVIAQYPETFLLRLPVAQFLADFPSDRPPEWRVMAFGVKADREILRQLQGRIFFVQPKQTGGKINHIPVRLTAETVEPVVNFHTGMFVIMEGTAGHPIPANLHPVIFRSLPCGDSLLHRFKHIRFSHLQTEKKAPGFHRKSGAS